MTRMLGFSEEEKGKIGFAAKKSKGSGVVGGVLGIMGGFFAGEGEGEGGRGGGNVGGDFPLPVDENTVSFP